VKVFYYIKYFFYIALNWNIRLAAFTIYHEIRGERKYGIDTSVINDLKKLTITGTNRYQAETYQGSGYYLLEKVFEQLNMLHAGGAFVDFGCGKGRVMVVAAHHGFKNITGIEFAKELYQEALWNCNRITERFPGVSWRVIYADAAHFKFKHTQTVFFFFNPFKEKLMKQVIKNMLISIKIYPRKIFVIYINPQHKNLFLEKGFNIVYAIKKMDYAEACVLEKKDP